MNSLSVYNAKKNKKKLTDYLRDSLKKLKPFRERKSIGTTAK